jgi:hypothetical protein
LSTVILDSLFDDEFNKIVIKELKENGIWRLATDADTDGESCDEGFNYLNYSQNPNSVIYPNPFLQSIGKLVFEKTVTKVESDPAKCFPVRFLYNYYNRSSSGQYHLDSTDPNSKSIVYYFNTCDGGTYVGQEFIKSESGKAVVFNSNVEHKGIGPKLDKQRYVLNVIYSIGF